jgi:hypothetical protein
MPNEAQTHITINTLIIHIMIFCFLLIFNVQYIISFLQIPQELKSTILSSFVILHIIYFSLYNIIYIDILLKEYRYINQTILSYVWYFQILFLGKYMKTIYIFKCMNFCLMIYFAINILPFNMNNDNCTIYSNYFLCYNLQIIITSYISIFIFNFFRLIFKMYCSCQSLNTTLNTQTEHHNNILNIIQSFQIVSVNNNENTCAICLEDSKNDERWKMLLCSHKFHPECINRWLINKPNCPICRTTIIQNNLENNIAVIVS